MNSHHDPLELAEWPAGHINYRALFATFTFLVVAVLSAFITKRAPGSFAQARDIGLARWLVFLVLLASWFFILGSGIIVLGIGTSSSAGACYTGLWCLVFYASAKIIIYAWLMERVHIVYTSGEPEPTPRFKSKTYRLSLGVASLWVGVVISMILGRISFRRQTDGICVHGSETFSTIPMLVVDCIVNIYLTGMFVWPLLGTKFHATRALALKSSIASIAALVTSATNCTILTIFHGTQLSWICLSTCGLDITINAIILFLITSPEELTAPTNPETFVTKSPVNHGGSRLDDCYETRPTFALPHLHKVGGVPKEDIERAPSGLSRYESTSTGPQGHYKSEDEYF